MTEITSSQILADFDRHYKVSAGPGAGKTTWLASHIKNIVRNSDRLHNMAKVLCISYTNVACETIRGKILEVADSVEVATIHSFLFKSVVRPYLHLLLDDDGGKLVAHELVETHRQPSASFQSVLAWLTGISFSPARPHMCKVMATDGAVRDYLCRLLWRRTQDGTWRPAVLHRPPPKGLPTTRLYDYKRGLWRRGIIEHDDVLYFAYCILEKYPQLRIHLGARFPYVFVDEFQDTDPRQTQIVVWMADDGGSTVCVVGDPLQAIFGFAGAQMKDFLEFSLSAMENLVIPDNWRSTDRIVKVLNYARTDGIIQVGLREVRGQTAELLVGGFPEILGHLSTSTADGQSPVILARDTETVAQFRAAKGNQNGTPNPWPAFDRADHDRSVFFKGLIEGLTNIRAGHAGLGVKAFLDGFHVRAGANEVIKGIDFITKETKRAIAVTLLTYLNSHYEELAERPFIETYRQLSDHIKTIATHGSLKGVKNGEFSRLASGTTLRSFFDAVSVGDDTRDIRTMHKAKGAEFQKVLVWLNDESRLDHLFAADSIKEGDREEQRITYVAVSRARDKLYIGIPTLSPEREQKIQALKLDVEITRIPLQSSK